jgi:hypothetical protein
LRERSHVSRHVVGEELKGNAFSFACSRCKADRIAVEGDRALERGAQLANTGPQPREELFPTREGEEDATANEASDA